MFLRLLGVGIAVYTVFLLNFVSFTSAQANNTHEPGVTITDAEFNATLTDLEGFEECSPGQQRAIAQAWSDIQNIFDKPYITSDGLNPGIDFGRAAAIEYLGMPFSATLKQSIQGSWFVTSNSPLVVD